MKKKGFTLIELLAVIVILAVIAIMVTPMIVSTINSAKENAAKASALNYIDAVEQYAMSESAKGNTLESKTYNISELSAVGVNGKKPTSGTVTISNNIVTDFDLTNDGYEIKRTGADGEVTVIEAGTVVQLTGTPIGTITDNLMTAAGTNTYTYLGGTYLKGAQTNNYVWFNGFVWRIMGKDADGNIRMITEENVIAIPWGESGKADKYGSSYARKWTSEYFYSHIKDKNIIKDTQFCEDGTGVSYSSARTTCSVAIVGTESGLLSFDEYNLSGGSSSYLVNGQYYWTLTSQSSSNAWRVDINGSAGNADVTNAGGLRPVITISSDAIITGGDGTLRPTSNVYILNQTLDNITNKKVSEVVTSGEYVKYDGRTYRVVETNSTETKLILDEFYTTDIAYGTDFNTGMGATLNDTNFQKWLFNNDTTLTSLKKNYTWDFGTSFDYGNDYATYLSSKSTTPFTGNVGLIKVGEMMSGQSLSMLTTNYANLGDVVNRYIRTKGYWTLTPQSTSYVWGVNNDGSADSDDVTNANGLRPVIVITSDAKITGGNGTLTSPFEVN
jgi:type IV pilus assembly protein PilA